MLVVKVEVWPAGDFDRAFEIARTGLANVSGLAPVSDYEVTALMARDRQESVLRAHVLGHTRACGWLPLVEQGINRLRRTYLEPSYADPVAELLRRGHRV